MNNRIQARPILTGTRASVFWGWDLDGDNRRFLESLDPGFFGFTARTCGEQLEEGSALERADRLRAGMNLRLAYGQASETLFALLGALAQAPSFPLGWMLRYKVAELKEVVEAIESGHSFPNLMAQQPVTWESLSALVYSQSSDVTDRLGLVPKFAGFWSRTAEAFLSVNAQNEYNSLKHGLRVMPGGFSIAFGPEKGDGQPSPPEQMHSMGGSEFGSSLAVPVWIEGADKHHFALSHRSRNWSFESLAVDLQLMEQSIANVVSCLRILAGTDPVTVRFSWPREAEAFDRYRSFLPGVEALATGHRVSASQVTSISAEDVRKLYEDTKRNPADGAR